MPSSVVKEFGYDKTKRILRILFVSEMIYDYLEVPEEIFLAMGTAQSRGFFLNHHIKPHYAFRKIGKRKSIHPLKKNHLKNDKHGKMV